MASESNASGMDAYERAAAHYAEGRIDEAGDQARAALAENPHFGPALHMLALLAHRCGDWSEALDLAERAVQSDPDSVRYRKTLVQILQRCGSVERAIQVAEEGLRRQPESVELLDVQAEALLAAGRPVEALSRLRAARQLAPRDLRVLLRIGEAFTALGRRQPAVEAFTQAQELAPADARAPFGLGVVLRNEGDYEGAKHSFLRALEIEPDHVEALIQLARIGKAQAGDFKFERLQAGLGRPGLGAPQRARIHLALGKMYEDAGDFDAAFEQYQRGNEQRAIADTRPPAVERLAAASAVLRRCCDADFFAARTGFGAPTPLPVFVVGMPRSGTTLVETILACHPQVHGAGELVHVPDIVRGLLGDAEPDRWEPILRGLDADTTCRAGAEYALHLQSLAPGAGRIVDKLPDNFRHLWLIALLLPQARVIHVRRDALDTCLSCFTTDFATGHNYRNDLVSLGRYHALYRGLMEHWRRVVPLRLLEIDYESLVTDQETTSRRLVDFLGLDWDPACLDFHRSGRAVQTASNVQVGRPLYGSSVGRWRRFEKHLGPLRRALADEADPRGRASPDFS